VPVTTDEAFLEEMRSRVGELPLRLEGRFMADYGMSEKQCEIILADRQTSACFEEAIAAGSNARTLTKQFMGIWNHLASSAGTTIGKLGIPAAAMAELARLVNDGVVSATAASQVAERLYQTRTDGTRSPEQVARDMGLIQEQDESALRRWVELAFNQNPQAVADALGGNAKKAKAAAGFLRGQIMRLSQGKADPKLAGGMIDAKMSELRSGRQ